MCAYISKYVDNSKLKRKYNRVKSKMSTALHKMGGAIYASK